MIKNKRQLSIVKTRAERLAVLADELEGRLAAEPADPRARIEAKAVRGELARLRSEVEEYEALESGRSAIGEPTAIDDIPRVLVRARIAARLSQGDLAERLGIHEQQIQRYEANDYQGASLSRLSEVARVLDVSLGPATPDQSLSTGSLLRKLEGAGVDRTLVLERIAPPASRAGQDDPAAVLSLIGRISRVFGWQPEELINDSVEVNVVHAAAAGFKAARSIDDRRLISYACYAHYLADLALRATTSISPRELTGSVSETRESLHELGGVTMRAAVEYAWSKGVVVLPLLDPGAFHGAYWRHGGRGVIVLKQRRRTGAIWLFDLLHELRHAADDSERPEREIIELPPDDVAWRDAPAELEANSFATKVLLRDPDVLFDLVWSKSGGHVERLKRTVALVARREDVDVGALAFHMAHALQSQGIDWWAAATSMQPVGDDPWSLCRDAFIARVNLDDLAPLDRELLTRALTEPSHEVAVPGDAQR